MALVAALISSLSECMVNNFAQKPNNQKLIAFTEILVYYRRQN